MAQALTVETTPLADFLSRAASRGFKWGEHDCMLFVADWAKSLTGQDPGTQWRGVYKTEREGNEILARGPGPGPILHGALGPLKWVARAAGFREGDIVVVRAPTRTGMALAAGIYVGRGRTAVLTKLGVTIAPVPIMLGWTHPNNG